LSKRLALILVAVPTVLLVAANKPQAADSNLLRALHRLPSVERAAAIADGGRGGPDAVQAQYDAARDFQEALFAAGPVSHRCRPLRHAALTYARAQIMQAEGVDRPLPSLTRRGLRLAAVTLPQVRALRARCHPRPVRRRPPQPQLLQPRSGEMFFGHVRARVAQGARSGQIYINRKAAGRDRAVGGLVSFSMVGRPGVYNLKVCSQGSRGVRVCSVARSVWFLPRRERRAHSAGIRDQALSTALGRLGARFHGYAGFWVHNLSTGETASWNSDARFPAASTVKLAVLAAALHRWGPHPESSRVAYDLRAMTGWSSNLATNRLLEKLGGSQLGGARIAQRYLYRLGARASTFTGGYRVGTGVGKHAVGADVVRQPPLISSRVTTAHDLGRMLSTFQAGALGKKRALRKSGLTGHEASVGLSMLLSSQPRGDNIGLFRPTLGRRFPMAQKNGWISEARHTAALLYGRRGPEIAVLMTFRHSLKLKTAAKLGHRFLGLLHPKS